MVSPETPIRKIVHFVAIAFVLGLTVSGSTAFASSGFGQESTQLASPAIPRIVESIDESKLVTLRGNTPPAARAQNDKGRVQADLPMTDLILVLKRSPERQAAFDKFVASQYQAGSPNFHHWLDAEQVGENFGPAQSDIDVVSNWLMSHQFSVDEVAKDRMTIRFSGTAGQVEAAFHTEIHNLLVKGEAHVSNMTDPQLPQALLPAVVGVKALHNFFPRPLHKVGGTVRRNSENGTWERIAEPSLSGASGKVANSELASGAKRPRPQFGTIGGSGSSTYPVEDVAPYDFATIYNVLPLWNANIDGKGQTIAIAGTSNINLADVTAFRSAFGLPAYAASPASGATVSVQVANGTDPGQCTATTGNCTISDLIENSLDVEWSGAVAKGASIVLVVSGANSATTDTLYSSEHYIVQNKTAEIMNVSYGECELGLGVTGNQEYNTLWQTASSEGIAVFVSTGDSGAAGCDQGDNQQLTIYAAEYGTEVSGISSTPYNTAVGGTDFNWGSTASPYWGSTNSGSTLANALGYVPEVPWNDTCTNPLTLAGLESDASTVGVAGVNDAESACNFVADYYQSIYQNYSVDLSFFVNTVGGTGGKSSCINGDGANTTSCTQGYPKPSWQSALTPADASRDVPDVSFFASSGFLDSAYLICVSADGACSYSSTAEPTTQEVGGTSVASPAMAGVMALINQKSGAKQGTPNAELYALAGKQSYAACSAETVKTSSSCYFNDINTGTIAMPCDAGTLGSNSPNCTVLHSGDGIGILNGYAATTGYDQATGLGSLNVANVVNAWPSTTTAPAVTLTPTSLTFAATTVNTAAATQAITLNNTGTAALTISGVTVSGANATSFTETNTCGTTVATGASCTITVTFKPTVAGSLTAAINVADNAAGSPQTVALAGTGTPVSVPVVSLSPTSLTFASTLVGSAAATQNITLKNTGTAPLTISGFSITGTDTASFTQTNTCGTSVAASASCTITVTFKPTLPGSLTASLTVVDNAAGSPQTVALAGTATQPTGPAVSLSPTSLTFPATNVGSSAPTQMVTLKNTGGSTLTISNIAISGPNASSFSLGTACFTTLAADASCVLSVNFKPTTAGPLTATLTFTDNAPGSPQTVTLKGTGISSLAVALSHTSLTFGSTTLGTSSAVQTVVVQNTGAASVSLTGITLSGNYATSFIETNNCGSVLAAAATCTISVHFTPLASGTLTALISIADNATNSPQKVSLSGTGTGPIVGLTRNSLAFGTTLVGSPSAVATFTLKNVGNATLGLAYNGRGIFISGADASSFSETNNCGLAVVAGGSCNINVTFKPASAGTLTATLSFIDNASPSTQTVSLSGTGSGPLVSLSKTSLAYGSVQINEAAASQSVTLTNSGNATLGLSGSGRGFSFTGSGAASYSQTNNCGVGLFAGGSCTITVNFKPTGSGSLPAALQIVDNAFSSPQLIALSGVGTGTSASLSTTALAFTSTTVGSTAATQTVMLSNTSGSTLGLSGSGRGFTFSGTGASSYSETNTCGAALAAGKSCVITVSFKPTATGSLPASLVITDNAYPTTQTVTLTGTGK
jgi:subtilase family serine protease